MNRHERRRARRMERESKFYNDYVAHLPRLPQSSPLERGKVYHVVTFHDRWCDIYSGKGCNCSPDIVMHVEPERS